MSERDRIFELLDPHFDHWQHDNSDSIVGCIYLASGEPCLFDFVLNKLTNVYEFTHWGDVCRDLKVYEQFGACFTNDVKQTALNTIAEYLVGYLATKVNEMTISQTDMANKAASGESVLLGFVGIMNRPVYQIGEKVFRQYMQFDKGNEKYVPGDFYEVSAGAVEQLKKILVKDSQ